MERFHEKYGWMVYLALGLLWLVVGIMQAFFPDGLIDNEAQLVTDMSWNEFMSSNPAASELIRFTYGGLGLLKMSWSLLVLVITLTGYRRGEKWAWYTLWLVPILLVGCALFNARWFGRVNEALQFVPITSVSLFGLILPYRKFFPKKSNASTK